MGSSTSVVFTQKYIQQEQFNNFELINNYTDIPNKSILGCLTENTIQDLINNYPEFTFTKTLKCDTGHQIEANRNAYLGDINTCCSPNSIFTYTLGNMVFTCSPQTQNPARFSDCDSIYKDICIPNLNTHPKCIMWIQGLYNRTYTNQLVVNDINSIMSTHCSTNLNTFECGIWIEAARNAGFDVDNVVTNYCSQNINKCGCLIPTQQIIELQKNTTINQVCWNRDCVFAENKYLSSQLVDLRKTCKVNTCVASIDNINTRNINVSVGCNSTFNNRVLKSNKASVRDTILPSNNPFMVDTIPLVLFFIIMIVVGLIAIPKKRNTFIKQATIWQPQTF